MRTFTAQAYAATASKKPFAKLLKDIRSVHSKSKFFILAIIIYILDYNKYYSLFDALYAGSFGLSAWYLARINY